MLTLSFVICTFFGDPSKHVPIALENLPKSAQNVAKKNAQIVLEFLKRCLKFRSNARELLAVFNYLLADVHTYPYCYFLTLDFLIGDHTRSETPMPFFFKINCSNG